MSIFDRISEWKFKTAKLWTGVFRHWRGSVAELCCVKYFKNEHIATHPLSLIPDKNRFFYGIALQPVRNLGVFGFDFHHALRCSSRFTRTNGFNPSMDPPPGVDPNHAEIQRAHEPSVSQSTRPSTGPSCMCVVVKCKDWSLTPG